MDIHSTFETLAEAWVAASTPTAVNPEPKSLKNPSIATSDQSSMLPKEQQPPPPPQQQQQQSEKSKDSASGSNNGNNDNSNDDDAHMHPHPHLQHHEDSIDLVSQHRHQAPPNVLTSPSPGLMRDPPITLMTTLTSLSSARSMAGVKTPSPRKAESSQPGIASMPIRCVVEHVNGAVNFDNATSASCDVTAVEQDAFAILPISTPLCDLVRTALARLGYSATDAVNAKGAIQLKNWKPLSFDVITDNKEATIDDILRELKEYTLRIRLSSLPRLSSVEEMKEKLLQLLLTTSLSLLLDNGCPVEKSLLMSLSKGENFNVAEDMVAKFDSWYSSQLSRNMKSTPTSTSSVPSTNTNSGSSKTSLVPDSLPAIQREEADISVSLTTSTADTKLPSSSSSSSSSAPSLLSSLSVPSSHPGQLLMNGAGHFTPQNQTVQLSSQNPILTPSKTRIRTSFDPEHEIPRLQRWFQENQHPSREQMVRFMSELNNLDSRRGRRPLDLTNIIYWFKNARAAQRRATKALDDSFENEENVDVSGARPPSAASTNQNLADPPAIPPYLPNKNAVYIVPYPYHSTHPSPSHTVLATPEPVGDCSDEPCDLSIKKLKDTTSNQQELAKPAPASRARVEGSAEMVDRNNPGHKTTSLPNGFSAKSGSREGDTGYKSPSFNGVMTATRKTGTVGEKSQRNGEAAVIEERKLLEKHYQNLKEQEEREEQRLVVDVPEDAEASSDESVASDIESSRLKMQEDEEMDYVRARAELGMGMSRLASTSESSAASMAALSLAQMSQPTLQIPMSPLNPLAMYYNLPPYYHPSPSHHSQSSAAATAAMVAAFSGSAHINGHNNNHNGSCSSSVPNPQSPAGGRPVPIQPSPHPPLSASQGHSRSSEPRKRRTRVFIDPLTEIPKLEKWFLEDTHPSAYMIDKYTETLNTAEYRQKFPKLEPKNIQLWFKNHRAKVKRQRMGLAGEESLGDSPPHQGSRSTTPLPGIMAREAGSSGSASGVLSSPDNAGSSKHSDDIHNGNEEDMEEGEQ